MPHRRGRYELVQTALAESTTYQATLRKGEARVWAAADATELTKWSDRLLTAGGWDALLNG